MSDIYDVIIVGLGPAGSTLGRLLNDKLSVLALDKKSVSGGFKKPCGGLLAPDAQKSLARFGLTLPKSVLVDPQIFSVETIDLQSSLKREYSRSYVNMDRHAFDLWLMSLLPPNVTVITDAVFTGLMKTDDGFSVAYKKNGAAFEARAKYVVGADGAASVVAKSAGIAVKARRYAAIQRWFRGEDITPRYICAFDSSLTDCYMWGLTKDEYFILGGAFSPNMCRARFETFKEKTELKLGEEVKSEACAVLRPNGVTDCRCGKDGVFLAGEAAGFISPSSLEGISWAFDSASALANALNSAFERKTADPLSQYSTSAMKLRVKLFSKHMKQPFIYYPPLRRFVMKIGAGTL
ncbi:MAG: FAD-binding protein [Clostridiales bacterium]|jgi:flavin-dependent dehydrogenase|nr:FAD-binding protein [Clostridiales bacterium]